MVQSCTKGGAVADGLLFVVHDVIIVRVVIVVVIEEILIVFVADPEVLFIIDEIIVVRVVIVVFKAQGHDWRGPILLKQVVSHGRKADVVFIFNQFYDSTTHGSFSVIARPPKWPGSPVRAYWIVSFVDVNPGGCMFSGGFFSKLQVSLMPLPGIEPTPSES